MKLGGSPASLLSCNRTIVRIQRVAGTLHQLPAGRRVRTILRGYKPAVRRVPAVKKIKKDIDICSNQYYIYIIN